MEQMRIKEVEFNDDGWHVDSDGRMFIRSKFTSDKADRIGDIIERDATKRASEEWRKWGNIRLQHDSSRPIGALTRIGEPDGLGWNVLEAMIVDEQAKELVRNGVLKAMSVGIIPLDFELIDEDDVDFDESPLARISWMPAIKITDYVMVEVSLVDHPMNYDAILQSGEKSYYATLNKMYSDDFAEISSRIRSYKRDLGISKGATQFNNLSLLTEEIGFDVDAAQWRVAKWASEDASGDEDKIDWERYRKAFFWCDPENPEKFASHKLQFADVFDGRLKAVWRGVTAASDALQDDVGIPESDIASVQAHIGRYENKYGDTQPFEQQEETMEKELEVQEEEQTEEAPQEDVEKVASPEPVEEKETTDETEEKETTDETEEKATDEPVEVSTKDVLDAVLALSTQLVDGFDKILEAMSQEKSVETEEEETSDDVAVDIEAVEERILGKVETMLHELRQPQDRKSVVETHAEDEPDYQAMSTKELEVALKERLKTVFPDRI